MHGSNKRKVFDSGSSVFLSFLSKLKIVLLVLIVFRVGVFVPIPGAIASGLSSFDGVIFSFMNTFSGGALQRMSVFALGIMPYISASIILQLLSFSVPYFESLKKDGDFGRRLLMKHLRFLTLLLSLLQAFAMSLSFIGQSEVIDTAEYLLMFSSVVSLVAGAFFLLWLGEKITEYAFGNGVSLIIFFGIVSSFPQVLSGIFDSVNKGSLSAVSFLLIIFLSAGMVFSVVFVEKAIRKIQVMYARSKSNQSSLGRESPTYLPLKVNMAGVIPPIFATSMLMFPSAFVGWLVAGTPHPFFINLAHLLEPGQPLYFMLFSALVLFFCFFYAAIIVNPDELADTLKRVGAVVPGVRPGASTSAFIDSIHSRLALIGSFYMICVCLLPQVAQVFLSFPLHLGGTSLLIVVAVVMDFISQAQNFVMSGRYPGLVRKAKITSS